MSDKRQFAIGQHLTYKDPETLEGGKYYYKGENQEGFIGKLVDYRKYNADKKCWDILVTYKNQVNDRGSNGYLMLESEFEEYSEIYDELLVVRKLLYE